MSEPGQSTVEPLSTATVTVLFTDLVGSTELLGKLGEEAAERLRRRHFGLLREVATEHGGREVKTLGDGIMLVYPSALGGLRCAVELQRRVEAANASEDVPLSIRIGVNHGEATLEGSDFFGRTVVVAKRLCDRADPGQILAGEIVRSVASSSSELRFVELGGLALKGLADPVVACEVLWSEDGVMASGREPSGVVLGAGMPAPSLEAATRDTAGVPLHRALLSEAATPLVGRSKELEQLAAIVDRSCDAGINVALVTGEAGIGKTRLVAEAALRAHSAGAIVLYGRCDEESLLPYQPFLEALTHLAKNLPPAERSRLVGADGPYLQRLVPGLGGGAGGTDTADSGESDRHQLFLAVENLFARVSSDRPVVLVLDDLHWADQATVLLLKHMVRLGEPGSLVIVGTYRDAEVSSDSTLGQAVNRLRREGLAEVIALRGLDQGAVTEMIANWAAQPAPAGLSASVWRGTEGHPLFVKETLRHLLERQAIYDQGGRLLADVDITGVGVPDGVEALVSRRANSLGEAARKALTIGAVVGREFSLDVLARASETPLDEVAEQLEEAVAAGVLTESPGRVGYYRFSHMLIREAVYQALSSTRRSLLHARVGESLESLGSDQASELAHHFFQAATRSDVLEKAISYALTAGDVAGRQLAYEDAATQYDLAVRGLRLQDPLQQRLCRALVSLGQNQWRAGDYKPARRAFLDAAELAQNLHLPEELAHAALGFAGRLGFEVGIVNPTMIEFLERAAAELAPRSALRALVLGRLAEALIPTQDLARAGSVAEQAVDIARECGEPGVLAQVLSHAMWTRAAPELLQQRREAATEIYELATEAGLPDIALEGRLWRIEVMLESASVEELVAEVRTCEELAEARREPYFSWLVEVLRAMLSLGAGDVVEAERLTWSSADIGAAFNNASALELFGVQILHIRQYQRRLGELHAACRAMTDYFSNVPALRAGLALLYAEIGRLDDAHRELRLLAAEDFAGVPRDFFWLVSLYLCADVAVTVGDIEIGEVVYDKLLPFEERPVIAGAIAAPLGFVGRALGIVADLLDRPADARRHLEDAVRRSEAAGLRAAAALAQVELAAVLRRSGDADDVAAAEQLVTAAGRTAERLGLEHVAHRIGRAAPSRPPAARLRPRRIRAAISTRGRSALGRLLGDSSDEDIERRFGSSLALRTLFATLTKSYQPALSYGFEGEIRIELTRGPGAEQQVKPFADEPSQEPIDVWTITVSGSRARAEQRTSDYPAVAIRASVAVFVRIVAGLENIVAAWTEGQVEATGDIVLACRMVEMFGGVDPIEVMAPEPV